MTSDPKYDWRKIKWTDKLGRAGFVPKYIVRLPLRVRTALCRLLGHPIEAIEPIKWHRDTPGHMCSRCYQAVDLSRIL